MSFLSSQISRPVPLRLALLCAAVAFALASAQSLDSSWGNPAIGPVVQLVTFVEGAVLLALGHGAWHGSRRAAFTLAGVQAVLGGAHLLLTDSVPALLGLALSATAALGLVATPCRLWYARVTLAWVHADEAARANRADILRYQAIAWCVAPLGLAAVAYSFGVKPLFGALVGLPLVIAGLVLLVWNRRL